MTRGTVIMAVLALLSAVGAYAMRPVEMPPPTFEDTGEPLFPEFGDPNQAHFLEVVEYDDKAAQLNKFSVRFDPKRGWVIPSHNGYPADGTEQMGKAAASFIGAKKDVIRSDDPKDHAEFGVVDPEDPSAAEGARGRRVTIENAGGIRVVDVIVGKDVPDRAGYKFVRYPGQNRVYAVALDPQVSTNFTEWIEDDLLHLEADDVAAVLSNSYTAEERVDLAQGKVDVVTLNEEPVYFERPLGDPAGPGEWAIAAPAVFGPDGARIDPATWAGDVPLPAAHPVPEGKVFNQTAVKQIVGAADRMKIVGVRPRSPEFDPAEMRGKGFFLKPEPGAPGDPGVRYSLVGEQGQVTLFCKDGVVYTLFFGEVTYATGEALSAGGEGEDAAAKSDDARANRYMFVNVSYDPRRDQTRDEPPREGEPRGAARAEQLSQRFASWYYVIQDLSFVQVHKLPSEFFKDG